MVNYIKLEVYKTTRFSFFKEKNKPLQSKAYTNSVKFTINIKQLSTIFIYMVNRG